MVKTIDGYHDRPSPTLATTFGSVSKLRSQASLHGVNHNMPFTTALKSLFSTFSALSPLACFQCVETLPIAAKHAEGMSLRNDAIWYL